MTMIEVLGYMANFFFVSASVAQARKVYIEGHADGLSYGLLLQLIIGLSIMLVYVPMIVGIDYVLLFGYAGQLVCIVFMLYYKLRARKAMIKEIQDAPDLEKQLYEAQLSQEAWAWDESKGQYVDIKEKK